MAVSVIIIMTEHKLFLYIIITNIVYLHIRNNMIAGPGQDTQPRLSSTLAPIRHY